MANADMMGKRFGVVMSRMVLELNGVSCLPLETAPPPKKQIVSSRSFGQLVTNPLHLAESVATHAAIAAEKLRREGEVAGAIQVFVQTNPFIPGEPQYMPALLVRFSTPTDDSAMLIQAARVGLRKIYRKEYRYKKAGVMLLDLSLATVRQGELFDSVPPANADRRARLMVALDTVNAEMGRGTLSFLAEGTRKPWRMRRDNLSQHYTSAWDALPTAS